MEGEGWEGGEWEERSSGSLPVHVHESIVSILSKNIVGKQTNYDMI